MPATLGAEATDRWLWALGLPTISRWHVEIEVVAGGTTSFELAIYAEEWGFVLHNAGLTSWIRVTDIPFVHGRDDFRLLDRTPDLLAITHFVREREAELGLAFRWVDATIRTNIPDATEIVRDWLLMEPPPLSNLRKTMELCGAVMPEGIRCSKARGHDGDHESPGRLARRP